MKTDKIKRQRGFTLLELLVASGLGMIVILVMTSLFKTGMDATFTITQRAETQQNMRAAIELMTKDLGMAGAGLPSGGLQLVTGGTTSKFGCDQGGTCYVVNNTYPTNQGVPNYMYGIIPGYSNGVQNGTAIPNAPTAINDSITSIYCDYNFPLTNFKFTVPSTSPFYPVTVQVQNPATQPNNPMDGGGLQKGDVLLFIASSAGNGTTSQGTSSSQTAAVVAEITSISGPSQSTIVTSGSQWSISLAGSDPLNFNQAGTADGLAALGTVANNGNQVNVCRLNVVTYFLQVPPAGGTVQNPRLMRQVNGFTPVPVADNIINLQFTYDVIDSSTNSISANQKDPIGNGLSPASIQKINMFVMGESLLSGGKKSQSMYLTSSVSARNMSFCNVYAYATKSCGQ